MEFLSLRRLSQILVAGLMATMLLAPGVTGATVGPDPGTPCTDIVREDVPCSSSTSSTLTVKDPLFVLPSDPGLVHLPIFVVSGTVVLFETPNGTLEDQTTWSDVIQFFDMPGVAGSFAQTFPDAEPVGILLPANFMLSGNAVGVLETQTGVGTDAADFTVYTAGSATYQIHSDSPCCELPEPMEGTPEPSTMGLFGLGLTGVYALGRLKKR
jgi:hypothetical protein